jgi:hypothetical protein
MNDSTDTALLEELVGIERELATGDGDAYRRHLADPAVVIVPGDLLDREDTVAAMDASPGWDEFTIEDERLLALAADAAVLTYRFRARRGEISYEAVLSSAYGRRPDGSWDLVLHQQTPVG